MAMRESTNIWMLRGRQALAQLTGWGAWLAIFFVANNRYEWGTPRAWWLLGAVGAWSLWSVFRPLMLPAFRMNLHHLGLKPPRRDQWIPLLPDALRTAGLALIVTVIAQPQSSSSIENMTREGIDIVMAMDDSASMHSKEFRPKRLEAA